MYVMTDSRQSKAGVAAVAGILLLAAGCRASPDAQAPAANPQNHPPDGTQAAAYLGKQAAGHAGPRPPGGWDRSAR